MPPVPPALDLAFILTTMLTMGLLLWAAPRHRLAVLAGLGLWLVFQAVMAWNGFYTVTDTLPPRFALVVGPPLLGLLALLKLVDRHWRNRGHQVFQLCRCLVN